ncbi:ATP synthase subunit gamma-like protein [Leptotrombidium deliense]|uniref:ATP synthase subunit gamma-like protein n=1 Tax=Leptotrombidium deliense TaxID=299467 RepID=A0A443S1C3_9ACAR|nr:ATP synthase subunit gamma-like protein [Leptotrombidium deliense]
MSEPTEFVELQKQKWDPLLDWFRNRFQCNISATDELISKPVDPMTKAVLSKHLNSYNIWTLTGFVFVIENLKSLILSLALLDKHITVKDAVNLSRLEVTFQTEKWGNVEWAHDLDLMLLRSRVSAGLLFAFLNAEKIETSTMKKSESVKFS